MSLGYLVYSYLSDKVAPHVPLLCSPSENTPLTATRKAKRLLAEVSTTQYHHYHSLLLRQLQCDFEELVPECPMASSLSPFNQFLDQNSPHISPKVSLFICVSLEGSST